eukprot:319685_1
MVLPPNYQNCSVLICFCVHLIHSEIYQYPSLIPQSIFYDTTKWISIHSTNCSFIESYIFTNYHLNIGNVACSDSFDDTGQYQPLIQGYETCFSNKSACQSFSMYIINNSDTNNKNEYSMFSYNTKSKDRSDLIKSHTTAEIFVYSTIYKHNVASDAINDENGQPCTKYFLLPTSNCVYIELYNTSGSYQIYKLFPVDRSLDLDVKGEHIFGVIFGTNFYFCIPARKYKLSMMSSDHVRQQVVTLSYALDTCSDFLANFYSQQVDYGIYNFSAIININNDAAQSYQIDHIMNTITKYVVELDDMFIIVCLCISNIITFIFIVIGLKIFENNIGFKHLDINLIFIFIV